MPQYHKVQSGECLASLTDKFGFTDYHAIWDDGNNAQLNKLRKNPNMLVPLDILYVPDKAQRSDSKSTSATHNFVIGGQPTFLRVVIEDENGKALAGNKYELTLDKDIKTGTLGSDGSLEEKIPPSLMSARLTIHTGASSTSVSYVWTIALGTLQPADTVSGVQARLSNLGYPCGSVDGIAGPRTAAAVRRFQAASKLPVTGDVDTSTRDTLRLAHDGV